MKIIKSMLPVSLLNLIALFFMIQRLPESIPIHFTLNMVADRFAGKWMLIALGILPIIVSAGLLIYLYGEKAENTLFSIVVIFCIIITWLPIYLASQFNMTVSAKMPIDLIILFPVGVLLIIVGSFLGAINYNPRYRFTGLLVGFRLPWIVKDEAVWKKTHAFGGYMGITGGIITCMFSLLGFMLETPVLSITGFTLGLLLCALVPAGYSYAIYKRRIVQ